MRALATLLLAATLAGCATSRAYEGEALPRESLAVIDESFNSWDSTATRVVAIDGRPLERGFGADKWEVLPGSHEIVATVQRPPALFVPEILPEP